MEEKKSIIAEFKEFINRGSAIDMAVGIIIGGAFTTIVNSLINDIINPLISIITGGGVVGQGLSIQVGSAVINFGALIGAIINFLLIAIVVFAIIKSMNTMRDKAAALTKKKEEEAAAEPEPEPEPSEDVVLLREIRDALIAKNNE